MARPPTRAAGLVAGAGTGARAGTGASTRYAGRSDAGPPPPQQQQQQQQQQPLVLAHTVGLTKPITMATSTPQPNHIAAIASASGRTTGRSERGPGEQPDRNIDKVVLGNICFRAWYPSYYGKEVLGDFSGHAGNDTKGGEKEGSKNGSFTANGVGDCKDDASGAKANLRRDSPPMLDRLYVCPSCFKYSKELVTWWEHVSVCERRGFIPGNKIYVHPKGRRTILVPSGPAPKPARGKRGSVGQKMVEEVIQDEGEWSIWEVDGEKDMLFCQNLSLFAKLFLDNKSVFFDVTGFNYFLLVHTPPALPTDPDLEVAEVVQPRGRVVGFFSKEKMSWDNNNLACILIFPPWQRKGLGALLMGISYEISRREGVIGGPEKPISDLGKKGYKRFWAGEIARWILTLETKSAPEETVVDVRECSRATWIAPDDCLLVLKDMGVAEDAGKGPPRVQEPKSEEHEDPEAPEELVQRIRISQRAVLSWVTANRVNLDKPCDPDGFVDGYAMKPPALSEEAS
ncbi:acyl-CoA N-acyltransferase [Cercophora scortea]|uniref:histone acetyltransferase n=1 Tax=Cercophora scortea TaxID=314031 RepID=A0AAE0I3D4_9PEZI|nr:acyl-CoA N-acyltransferase [Cercophora scortea]